jgi:hypothetical protein
MKPLSKNTVVLNFRLDDLVKLPGIEVGNAGDPWIGRLRGDDVVIFGGG